MIPLVGPTSTEALIQLDGAVTAAPLTNIDMIELSKRLLSQERLKGAFVLLVVSA
jgi:hypothetical protein